jgi:hypothetical protein
MYTRPASDKTQPRALPGRALASAALLAVVAALGLLLAPRASASDEPGFLFPWQDGIAWQTGQAGFHGTNDAIDFFPPDTPLGGELSCEWDPWWTFQESQHWILASAAGTVAEVGPAYILIDHGNGWTSRYYHLAEPQVAPGDPIVAGTRLGHPSTLGECTTGPHVHFWVHGPNGETTASVTLSGVPAASLSVDQWISQTGNFEPSPSLTPTPTLTATPTIAPTLTPTETAPVAGDADCDGRLTAMDAMFILRYAAELQTGPCTPLSGEVNCDGEVTVADAAIVLQAAVSAQPIVPDCAPTPAITPTPDPMSLPTPTPTATPPTE